MIPELQTERLVLRAWRGEDFEPYSEFMADSDVGRYLGGEPLSRADAWRNLAMILGHWTLRGYGMWAVEHKTDGSFVGRVGLWNPEGWPGLEVGWLLGKKYWGHGYATEAARAAMNFGFVTQNVPQLLSIIHVDNLTSQRVAQRLGLTRGERRTMEFQTKSKTVDLWTISRNAWAQNA